MTKQCRNPNDKQLSALLLVFDFVIPWSIRHSCCVIVSPSFLLQGARWPCMLVRNSSFRAPMNFLLIPKELRPIAEKVQARQRISEADALQLYRSNDLNALGIMASGVRQQKNGNYATYILNPYINYS